MEPLARTRAANLRFWRPTKDKNAKMSVPFEVPVYSINTKYRTPLLWVYCRIVVRAYKVVDEATGAGFKYRVQVYLVDRKTGQNLEMIHNVESVVAFADSMKATLRRAARAGRTARDEMDELGVPAVLAAKYNLKEASRVD